MTAFDFKKDRKDLYQPSIAPTIVDVPEMLFLMADGKGSPNGGAEFQAAMEALYSLAYAIRMNKAETGYVETVVPPSEGFWDFADSGRYRETGVLPPKDEYVWTMVLRQPEFVTEAVLQRAKATLTKRKPQINPDRVRLERYREGLCVQALHIGPYDAEPATVQIMERYQEQRGFRLDHAGGRRHHEIYLSNPAKTPPEKMKTILRLPVKRK